ncbi:MAG: amino acid adenylation domain-containing protein [[Clostridium] fimetarium]|nr:amino acid adenylation domain-containing protein [Alistipes timonensis]MCM1406125.1 amino acid adenylation domain-containing protein [[Clostridium] fimetarium]
MTDDKRISYAELDRRVNAVAYAIGAKGYGGNIGVVMPHGADMVAAMLAILKSGGAYVPAEPSLPADRIKYMMERAGVKLIITEEFFKNLPAECPVSADRSTPDGLAYILYTSGTTGHPKGVMVENHSVVNYAEAFEAEFHTAPGDVMLQYSVCSFDIFVEEVFTTLLNGATLAIPPKQVVDGDINALMDFVKRHGVTQISGFPYLLAEMNKLDSIPGSLRLLISGGDVLRASYIDRLTGKDVMIYNTYGPSETTVCATYFRCDNARPLDDGTFPIGKAVKGVSVRILGKDGREVAPGKTGEICIFGEGVSAGYLGNPPERKNFVPLPNGKRMYRSGDMGYLLSEGDIAFLHRRDEQVMILGKRVEPEEVENVLNTSPDVERGIVRAFKDDAGLSYLVAYFVPARKDFSLGEIKEWLRRELTDFMIPEYFVEVTDIPVNKRGKVDTHALPIVLKEATND